MSDPPSSATAEPAREHVFTDTNIMHISYHANADRVVMTARSITADIKVVSNATSDIVLALLSTYYKYLQQRNVMDGKQSAHHYLVAFELHAVDMMEGNQYLCKEAVQAPSAMEEADVPMDMFDSTCVGAFRSTFINCIQSLYGIRTLELRLHLGNLDLAGPSGWVVVSTLFEHIAWASIELYPNDITICVTLVVDTPCPDALPVLLRPLYAEERAVCPGRARFWKVLGDGVNMERVTCQVEGVCYLRIEDRLLARVVVGQA